MALHCPATMLLVGLPRLPDHGACGADLLDDVSAGAALLALSRVAAIYHSPDHASATCADTAASVLGPTPIVVPELERPMGVEPSATHRASRAKAALQDLADVHRGESVLVFAPRDVFQGARITMRPARRAGSVRARAGARSAAAGVGGQPPSGTSLSAAAAPREEMSELHIAALAIGDGGWFLAPWPGT